MNAQTNEQMHGSMGRQRDLPDFRDYTAKTPAIAALLAKIGSAKGALPIRNSWSTAWGEHCYGWIPYACVEGGLTNDFWSQVGSEFVDTELFR